MPTEPIDQNKTTPSRPLPQPDTVRQKLMEQGLCEEDIAAAVAWARANTGTNGDDKL